MTQFERDSVELDSIDGKWIVCKITWDKKEIHLVNIYAPTIKSKPGYALNNDFLARSHFFRSLNSKWSHHINLIVGGDFNNTPEVLRDKKYISPTNKTRRIEDMAEFNAFLYSHRLIDTYTNHLHDDEPRAMTHMSAQKKSYSRLDRFYHSEELNDITWVDNYTCRSTDTPPLEFLTDHYPITITLHNSDHQEIHQHKQWRLNMNEFNNPSNLHHIAGLLLSEWESVKKNDQTACDALEMFKVKSSKYMTLHDTT